MPRPSDATRRRAALLVLVSVLAAQGTSAAIYKWVDEAGTPHFTDRIEEVPPEFLREAMSPEELGEAPFNQIEGLNVLPGEADGTDAGQMPVVTDPSEMQAQLEGWLENAGGGLLAGIVLGTLVVAGIGFAFMAALLLLACKVVGEDSPGFKKAYGIVIVQTLAGLLATPGLILIAGTPDPTDLGGSLRVQLASMALSVIVNALVLRGMLTDTATRALVIAVVTLLVTFGIGIALGVGVALLVAILA